jgi:hypothetical protein
VSEGKLVNHQAENSGLFPAFVVTGVFFLLYFLYRDHFVTGDALIYADNILRLRFNDISIHVGYYCLGYLVHSILGISGLAIDQSLILMSNFMGAIGLIYAYKLAEKLIGDRATAILSTVLLGASGAYLFFSTSAEVYVPQTALLLASMYYFTVAKPIPAGLSFSLALMISPLTLSIAPFYFYIWYWRRLETRVMLAATAAFALSFLPVFIALGDEWLWGRRGLLAIGLGTPLISFESSVKTLVKLLVKSFHFALLFLPPGLFFAAKRNRSLLGLCLIMFVTQFYILAKVGDVTVLGAFLLPVHVFIAMLAAFGVVQSIRWLKVRSRATAIGLSIVSLLFVVTSLAYLLGPAKLLAPKLGWSDSWREAMRHIQSEVGRDGVLIANFRYGVAYAFYTREDKSEELETTVGNRRWISYEYLQPSDLQNLIEERPRILVLESYSPSPGPEMLLSQTQLANRFEKNSMKSAIERMLPGVWLRKLRITEQIAVYEVETDSAESDSTFRPTP